VKVPLLTRKQPVFLRKYLRTESSKISKYFVDQIQTNQWLAIASDAAFGVIFAAIFFVFYNKKQRKYYDSRLI
jgi:hypothetical protein